MLVSLKTLWLKIKFVANCIAESTAYFFVIILNSILTILLYSKFLNQGKNIMAESEKTEGEDEEDFGHEFILWLTTTNDEASDEVADIIKDDLWSNPYQV